MSYLDDFGLTMQLVNIMLALPLICTLGVIGLLAVLCLKERPSASWCMLGAVCLWSIQPLGLNHALDSIVGWAALDPDVYPALMLAAQVIGSLLTLGGWALALYPLATVGPDECAVDEISAHDISR